MSAVKYPDVAVQLTGQSGNAFAVIAACRRAARRAGVPQAEVERFTQECTAGDNDRLLQTAMAWFDVC